MCREICEVVMSHEVKNNPSGGEDKEVEVDECYLTRRKYNVEDWHHNNSWSVRA